MRGGRRQQRRRLVGKILSMLACSDGTSRACGHAHANICTGYLLTSLNCWRATTEDKGFAGRKAPTKAPAGRENPVRVGVPRRNFKILRACPRQHLRRIPANGSQLLACPNGGQRLCGEEGANKGVGRSGKSCVGWRAPTELQELAGMLTPTFAPTLLGNIQRSFSIHKKNN